MYYKDNPYGQSSYPQAAYGSPYGQSVRAPLLPQGYTGDDLLYSGTTMDTVKSYLTKPWVIATIAILIIVLVVWFMSSKEPYYHY